MLNTKKAVKHTKKGTSISTYVQEFVFIKKKLLRVEIIYMA